MNRFKRVGLLACLLFVCGILSLSCKSLPVVDIVAYSEDGMPLESYVYKVASKRALTLEIDYPPDWRPGDSRPAIVFFFGGGWKRGIVDQFLPQAEYFAKRGMVCIRPDYRVESVDGVLPDKCVEDTLSAMRWVRKNAKPLGIDPDRIVSSGGSAGGLLAACAYFTDSLNSPGDDLSTSPKPNAMLLYNPAMNLMHWEDSELNAETRRQMSPAVLALESKEMVPTLFMVGTEDSGTLNNARQFAADTKKFRVPVVIQTAEGEKHGFFNYMPWTAKSTQWADEFLQKIGFLADKPKVDLPTQDALVRPEDRIDGKLTAPRKTIR